MTIELDTAISQAIINSNDLATELDDIKLLAAGLEPPITCPAPVDNIPPMVVVNLPQTVNENTLVNVLGTVVDSDGTYTSEWTQLSGTVVTIVEDGLDNMSFTAHEVAADEVLTFRLTAIDNDMAESSADTSVTISDVIAPPPPPPDGGGLGGETQFVVLNVQLKVQFKLPLA